MASFALAIALSISAQLAAPPGAAVIGRVTTGAPAKRPNAPEFPRVITGRVTIGQGHPLSGVLVEWGHFTDEPDERQSVETDEDGRYRLEIDRVGRDFRLGFSLAGFAPLWHDRLIPGPASKPTEIDVKLDRGTEITVQFTNQVGEPIAGLAVTPETPSNGFSSSFSTPTPTTLLPGRARAVTTDEHGRAVLSDLPPLPVLGATDKERQWQRSQNWLNLSVTNHGVSTSAVLTEAEVLSGEPLIVRLSDSLARPAEPPNGVLRGLVLDKATKQPIPAFQVVRRYEPQSHAIRNVDGEFRLDDALKPGGSYEMRIFAPGYAVAVAKVVAVSRGDAQPMTIELTPHPSLEGRLVDAAGQPLANAPLITGFSPERSFKYIEWTSIDRYADGHHSLQNVLRVITDEAGRFTIPEAPDAPSTLIVLAAGHEHVVVPPGQRPAPGADGVITLALKPAASVTAIALRDTPLGAAADSVTLSYASNDGFEHMRHALKFDEQDRVAIDGLVPGDYRLVLYLDASGMSFPSYSKRFNLAAGERKELPLGEMPGDLRLSGVAGPFNVVQVRPTFETDFPSFAVAADIDGRFELDGLLPGVYAITYDASSSLTGYRIDSPARTIQLTENTELDLTKEAALAP